MIIKDVDFEMIKSELISLYHTARKQQDFYVMEELDYLLHHLQSIENAQIKKKQKIHS